MKRNTVISLACQEGLDCENCKGCACRCHPEKEK